MSDTVLLRAAAVYPQPVAFACGRITYAATTQDRLDAILRASETLTRYLAALAIASFHARPEDANLPPGLGDFRDNLAFGQFLAVAQIAAKQHASHPLGNEFARAFKLKAGKPSAGDALIALLKLRNERGHDMQAISQALATTIFAERKPEYHLEQALAACETLLTFPLFLIEQTTLRQKRLIGRRLLLMGESAEPRPEELELTEGVAHDNAPYLGLKDGVLCLYPSMLRDLVPSRSTYGIYFIDKLDLVHDRMTYKTVSGDEREPTDPSCAGAWHANMGGAREPMENVRIAQTESFYSDWLARRHKLEEMTDMATVKVQWHQYDTDILRWYGRHLGTAAGEPAIHQALTRQLLDGRDRIGIEEARQLVLLFGQEQMVRDRLRRGLLDCRAQSDPVKRWDERVESSANILHCLRQAIAFFGRYLSPEGLTLDGLTATSGNADYIAVREGLVNFFIHQDYTDPSTVGQIVISPERATFFNAGHSLISQEALVGGGRSQSRNPLIGRALRLIGFAELAGSGLQQVQYAWRGARRRPPIFQSDLEGNTFTLILDWRPLPDESDAFWKSKLGVSVSAQEAAVLSLAAEPDGVSIEQIASSQGVLMEDAAKLADGLVRKALVTQRSDGTIGLKEHLLPLARAGSDTAAGS